MSKSSSGTDPWASWGTAGITGELRGVIVQISEVVGTSAQLVWTVAPRDRIADVVDVLAEYNIGAVVVTTDGRVINGIISERDVVRSIAREQEGTLRVPVEDLMTRNVTTCRLGDEVDEVMATMIRGHFRHMPILNDHNGLCGLVSLGDLVDAKLQELTTQNKLLQDRP